MKNHRAIAEGEETHVLLLSRARGGLRGGHQARGVAGERWLVGEAAAGDRSGGGQRRPYDPGLPEGGGGSMTAGHRGLGAGGGDGSAG